MYDGKPTAPAIAATLLQQGRVAMAQNNDHDALKYFQDSLTICKLNESKGNKGETSSRPVAHATSYRTPRHEGRSQSHFRYTQRTRKELLETGLFAWPEDEKEEKVWDSLVGIMHR
ncbi:hypothetical protein B7463_g3261, partial [Scytalidium lignicola]